MADFQTDNRTRGFAVTKHSTTLVLISFLLKTISGHTTLLSATVLYANLGLILLIDLVDGVTLYL
jgi:hypothetical protein